MAEKKEFDKFQYQNDYNKQNYDRITIMVPKGYKEKITELASSLGFKSRNEFIVSLIREQIGE